MAGTGWRRLLRAGLERHTDPRRGLSNQAVARMARALGIGERSFVGVYPADCIPRSLYARPHFTVIVNLGRWKRPEERGAAGHFVAVHGRPSHVLYLDSYGRPCEQPDVLRFLAECRRPVLYNARRIQALDSKACGFYAMLYAVYYDRGYKFRLTFRSGGGERALAGNDARCVRYLERISREAPPPPPTPARRRRR